MTFFTFVNWPLKAVCLLIGGFGPRRGGFFELAIGREATFGFSRDRGNSQVWRVWDISGSLGVEGGGRLIGLRELKAAALLFEVVEIGAAARSSRRSTMVAYAVRCRSWFAGAEMCERSCAYLRERVYNGIGFFVQAIMDRIMETPQGGLHR